MANKNKEKGKTFERHMANYLSEKYSESFVRNIDSGSYTGGKNCSRKNSLTTNQWQNRRGDIIGPDGWNINIEVKNYADLPFHQLFTRCKQLDTWIEQLEQVSCPGDVDIIFFKITRKGQYVCVKHYPCLDTSNALPYRDYFIFDLDTFLEKNAEPLKLACTQV